MAGITLVRNEVQRVRRNSSVMKWNGLTGRVLNLLGWGRCGMIELNRSAISWIRSMYIGMSIDSAGIYVSC